MKGALWLGLNRVQLGLKHHESHTLGFYPDDDSSDTQQSCTDWE